MLIRWGAAAKVAKQNKKQIRKKLAKADRVRLAFFASNYRIIPAEMPVTGGVCLVFECALWS